MITKSDIRDGFDTDLTDTEVDMAIAIVAQSTACMEKRGVPEAIARTLQIYAARHILTMQSNSGRGTVKSESAPSGAARSYSGDGRGYLELLKQLDKWGCVTALLEGHKGAMGIWSIGCRH